jgi:hypothetical protein
MFDGRNDENETGRKEGRTQDEKESGQAEVIHSGSIK